MIGTSILSLRGFPQIIMCSPFLSTPDLAIQIISACASRHGYIHHAARHTSFAFHGIHVSYVRSRILASLDTPLSLIFWLSTICAAQHYPTCELHALQRQSPIPTQAFLGHTSPLHITLDTYFSLAAAQLVGIRRHALGFSVELTPYAIEHNSTFSFKLQPSYPTDFKIYIHRIYLSSIAYSLCEALARVAYYLCRE